MRNPLSIEAFADWCEKKPADEWYKFADTGNCALAQFAKFVGVADFAGAGGHSIFLTCGRKINVLPEEHATLVVCPPHTFGALAKRLREASHA